MSTRVIVFFATGTTLLMVVIGTGLWLGQPPPPVPGIVSEGPDVDPESPPAEDARDPAITLPGEGRTEDIVQPSPVSSDIVVEPPTTIADNPPEAATVKVRKVMVRAGPDTRYHVLAKARKGQILKVSARLKGWCFVLLPSGLRGWIRCDLLEN